MTFNDLKDNEKLFMYFTITDTVLFVKKPEYSYEIDKLVDERSLAVNKDELASLVRQGKLDRRGQEEFIKDRKYKYFKEHLIEIFEEKEEWIDVEKYLLSCAFRIKNLLVLLEDPSNRDRFSQFDNFLPYRRIYAETLKEINRLLDGKNVRISHKAKHGMNPSGYWDDVKQAFVDADYSADELRRDYLTGPIQRALALENNASVDELKAFSEEPIRVLTDNPEIAPDDIREFALKMAQNNPNIQFMDVNQNATRRVNAQRRMNKEEEQNYIIKNAIEHNGLTRVGKNKILASFEGKDVDLDKTYVERLKNSMIHALEDFRDELRGDITYKEAIEVLYKLDPLILVGIEEDGRVRKALTEISEAIREKCNTDDKFCDDYVDGLAGAARYLREKINYDDVARVTPFEYVKKYGQEDAVRRKYNELTEMHKKKMIMLYSEGLLPFGLMKYDGIFSGEISHKELFDYMDRGFLTAEDVRRAIASAAGIDHYVPESVNDYAVQMYRIAKGDKKRSGSMQRKYAEIIPNDLTLKLLVDEEELFDTSDLVRKHITKMDVLSLDKGYLYGVLTSGKLNKLSMPSEEEILHRYGRTLTGKELIALTGHGIISDESIIRVYASCAGIKLLEPDMVFTTDDIKEFYTMDRLLKLDEQGKINLRFAACFNEGFLKELPKEERKEYVQSLIDSLKEKDEINGVESPEYLNKLFDFYMRGLFEKEDIEHEFSFEKIEDLLMDDKLDETGLIELYNNGFVGNDSLKEVFSNEEIEKLIKDGSLGLTAVLAIDKNREETIKRLIESKKMDMMSTVNLYLTDNGIDMFEFDEAVQGIEFPDGFISEMIDENVSKEKIEELFKKYYISQDDLSNLVARGIVTKEKYDELSEYLNSHQEFEKIFGANSRVAKLTEVTEGTGEGHTPGLPRYPEPSKNRIKNDPELQRKLLKALGADSRVVYLEGQDNSLDGYEVYGIEDLGVVVFGKFDKPNNSTYVMTVAQANYFLNVFERRSKARNKMQDGTEEVLETALESSATKQDIRSETEHVKIRNACAGWGKNIVDSIKELNPKIKEKLKDSKYKTRIDDIITEIRDDYEIRKDL